jgi:phospholipase/carboxylesterase
MGMVSLSIKRLLLLGVLLSVMAGASAWLWMQAASLSAVIRGGDRPPSLVLMHGYGSRAEQWLQFEHVIKVPNDGRMVFLQGPLRGPVSGSRGWWWLNIEGHISEGQRLPDFSTASPGGIKVASRLVRDYLENIDGPIVLGGFSQGAMLSGEVAFQSDQELAGLVLLGGTTVNEDAWVDRFPARRQLPIFIAHGRDDGVLPFAVAERFAGKLKAAGLNVTWVPFDGGHAIPRHIIEALNAFLIEITPPPASSTPEIRPTARRPGNVAGRR